MGRNHSFGRFCRSSRGKVQCWCKLQELQHGSQFPMQQHRLERNGFQKQHRWGKLKVIHHHPE